MTDSEIAIAIGAKIRSRRVALELSQKALASRLPFAERPQITRLEAGKHLPTLRTLIDCAKALECRLVDLIPDV